jgi:enoyl-CoA hydratase/carnithine racemase
MIDTSTEGRIKILRMRHGPANAMGLPFLTAVADAFTPNDSFDGVVLTGNGRFFSAGLNIVSLAEGNASSALEIVDTLGCAVTNIMKFPGPVVAAVDGHAVAGGCLLALACDHRIGLPGNYKMGLNELDLGLDLPPIGLAVVRKSIPIHYQFEVATLSRFYSPDEAVTMGLLNEVTENAEKEAVKLTASLAGSLAPFQRLKNRLFAPVLEQLKKEGDSAKEFIRQWKTPGTQEKIKAAVKKMKSRNV